MLVVLLFFGWLTSKIFSQWPKPLESKKEEDELVRYVAHPIPHYKYLNILEILKDEVEPSDDEDDFGEHSELDSDDLRSREYFDSD